VPVKPPVAPAMTGGAKPAPSVVPCPTCGGIPAAGVRLCNKCAAQSRALAQPIKGYQIVREIGHGSMGVVSLALSESTGQAVAIKTITPAAAGTPAAVERFRREARTLRALNHPNIIALLDEGESSGILYFVMQYVEGTDAAKLLRRDGPMAPRRAVRMMGPALEALAHAHSHGFVHRDIKPSNLLVTETAGTEKVWLADFGLARVYQASEMSGLTFNGDIGGTVAFMPPEQITEYRDAKPPSDQYAAAASLYNLLTGRYVYDLPEHDFQRSLLIVLSDDPVPIEKRRSDLPRGLPQVIKKALAREPAERYVDVAAFRQALRPFEN
jgi:eukaryotic-like serine/threonine-protein kinase